MGRQPAFLPHPGPAEDLPPGAGEGEGGWRETCPLPCPPSSPPLPQPPPSFPPPPCPRVSPGLTVPQARTPAAPPLPSPGRCAHVTGSQHNFWTDSRAQKRTRKGAPHPRGLSSPPEGSSPRRGAQTHQQDRLAPPGTVSPRNKQPEKHVCAGRGRTRVSIAQK